MYAVVDIETTGGRFSEEGITEIAIFKYDGHKVVDRFISLVNPMRQIDPYVTKLTGIDNKMLRRAPRFHEIAKRIVEITEGCVLVAHNADFDYRILRQEFARLGYIFEKNTICTVKQAQRLIPGMQSYSLGKLCHSLGIPVSSRHRAFGDAEATVVLLSVLIEKDSSKQLLKIASRPTTRLTEKQMKFRLIIDTMPTFSGIFQVLDKSANILYIGRANNIYKEINYLLSAQTDLALAIQDEINSVVWEETGNELLTQLKYINQVKNAAPILNSPIKSRKVTKSIRSAFPLEKSMIIIDKGRKMSEKAVVLIENGQLIGYAYCALNHQIDRIEILRTLLTPLENSPENLHAIRNYITRDKVEKIVYV